MNYKLPELLLDIEDGVIDLGWGHPSSSLYPSGDVREATEVVLPNQSATAFHYGAAQGFGPFLGSLSRFLSEIETKLILRFYFSLVILCTLYPI